MFKKIRETSILLIIITMVFVIYPTQGFAKPQEKPLHKVNIEKVLDEVKDLDAYLIEWFYKEEAVQNAKEEYEEQEKQIQQTMSSEVIDEEKIAYLTFDDGPSKNTIKILDYLKENNIKATFFVLGKANQGDVYRRIVEEGHTIAIHSQSHDYATIYQSVESFMKDINQVSHLIEGETGIKPELLRFPGGSNNTVSIRYGGKGIMSEIIPKIEESGYTYFDWNVDSSDASKAVQDTQVIINSVLNGAKAKHEAVILMHDAPGKTTTVEALPSIIKGLQEQGFGFKALTRETPSIQFK